MKASTLEFRFRVVIMSLIIALGFWAPWIDWLHWGTRTTAWLWLGFQLGALGISSSKAIELVTAFTVAVAAVAVILRVWGTAYLGVTTVNDAAMRAGVNAQEEKVLADGPYRYVRNPLYIGSFLLVAAISILMPSSGALVTLILLAVFLVRLILGEEAFLSAKMGQPFRAYCSAVPRLFPSLRTGVRASSQTPNWGRALLGETLALGVFASFATLSWLYNAQLLTQAVLISFGVSLVLRALLAGRLETTPV